MNKAQGLQTSDFTSMLTELTRPQAFSFQSVRETAAEGTQVELTPARQKSLTCGQASGFSEGLQASKPTACGRLSI